MSSQEIQGKLNTALKYHQSGQLSEAEIIYKQVIEEDPNNDSALNLYGILLLQHKRYDEAILYTNKAIDINPNSYFYINLGNIYKEKDDIDLAINSYQNALDFEPDNHKIFYSLGLSYKSKNDLNSAIDNYKKAIKLNPSYQAAYVNLGNIYVTIKQFNEAIECYKKAILLEPNDSNSFSCLGSIYLNVDEADEAIYYLKEAIKLKPDNVNAYISLGNAYINKGDFEKAIHNLELALELSPNNYLIYSCLANAYKGKREISKAINFLEKALSLNPECAETHFNLATAYLLNGNFEKGWAEYEWRFKQEKLDIPVIPDFYKYYWDGSTFEGKTIYVCYEQGYGDIIQFARFIPVLSSMGAKVIFKVPKALENLFKQNDLKADVISSLHPDEELTFDKFVYLLSLPGLLKITADNIPFSSGYFKADPDKIHFYKTKFFDNNKFKVGINWKGSDRGKKTCSIPFEHFNSLTNIPGIQLYSLSKEIRLNQNSELLNNSNIISLGESFLDFSDTAAAIENLDLVICNDTSVAHLAGALGKQTWLLLSTLSEWRWLMNTETSPWYDSLKLIRQSEPGNWSELFVRVFMELNRITSESV